ncbi:neuroglobin-like isoform X1 [Octopus sinensis]|uniref:Neuroglobin-like isoform X1 n=2 Tax=Octopus sinensis TaxID=2607531 RepID=A0A7E6F6C5_9MOLL|nr:neuroglobin-like isoform X1 [Octopus sinensis]
MMGCGLSFKSEKPKKKQKEVTSNTCAILSDRQNLLVRESWSIIQDEILTIGVYIYYSFFQSEYDLREYFSSIFQINKEKTKMHMNQDKLERHAMLLMETLGFAVSKLDEIEDLRDFLNDLGGKHYWRKVKPYMIRRLWPIIDDSFRQVLCDVYTTEVREAWQTFIEFIFDSMKEGIDAMSLAQTLSTECQSIDDQNNDKPTLNHLEENSDAELTISDETVDTKLLNK